MTDPADDAPKPRRRNIFDTLKQSPSRLQTPEARQVINNLHALPATMRIGETTSVSSDVSSDETLNETSDGSLGATPCVSPDVAPNLPGDTPGYTSETSSETLGESSTKTLVETPCETSSETAGESPIPGRSLTQALLLECLYKNGPCRKPTPELAIELKVNVCTLRNSIYKFKGWGWVTTGRWREGTRQGTHLALRMELLPADILTYLTGVAPSETAGETPRETPKTAISPPSEGLKDNDIKFLQSLREENPMLEEDMYENMWPRVMGTGLGPLQLARIMKGLQAVGHSFSHIWRSLDRAEAWLETKGHMLRTNGEVVHTPIAHLRKILTNGDYVPAPPGFIDPQDRRPPPEPEQLPVGATPQQQFDAWSRALTPVQKREFAEHPDFASKTAPLWDYWQKNIQKRAE